MRTLVAHRWLGIIVLGMWAWVPSAAAQSCAVDADCSPPTACRPGSTTCTQEGGILPDGGFTSSDPICVADPPTCTWVLTTCQTDADCTQPSWACTVLKDAKPPANVCFPKGITCPSGATCPVGWSCVDFASVKEKDLLGMWPTTGSTKFCWPDVIAGVPGKTMRVDSSQLGLTGGASENESGPRSVADGGTEGGSVTPGSDPAGPTSSSGASSGCSTANNERAPSVWPPLVLVLAWGVSRRIRAWPQ